ncbi:FAD-binding oxidoreductase [Nocardioides agariphilus]|nr:FAD-binding protein [Nocardioides agariphilus]
MPSTPPTAAARLDVLRGLCGGAVHVPGDPLYDEARMPWHLDVEAWPAAVAYPAFPDEVASVLRAAAAAGLRVAPQGTGHGAPPLSGRLGEAVLLRTSAMTELRIDPERRIARAGAGVLWGDVVARAGAHGLAARHTTAAGVGVVGTSLGGGLSWYARPGGLQCSALTAVELVLADGTFVRATDDSDADLMWAARGGGGGFGVVTALEFDLLPVSSAYAGMLAWSWAEGDRVLRAWRSWTETLPEAFTTVARLFRTPDEPWLPADVRGRRLVVIDGALIGEVDEGARLLEPLRALKPEIDTFDVVPPSSMADMHLDPEAPAAVYANSVLLDDLPESGIDALVAAAGADADSPLLFVEIRHLGGALSRPAQRPGVLDRITGDFLVLGVGLADGVGLSSVRDETNRVMRALQRWDSGASYLLMADGEVDERRGWSSAAAQRLEAVRAAADPDGLFIPPRPRT